MQRGAAPSVQHCSPSSIRRVLVVGAGVAGLQTARHLLQCGFNVLVLEATGDIGGVWTKNYHGYALQVPWELYVFPDFDWPSHLKPKQMYPSGQQVHQYVRAYVDHHRLEPHIKLHCKLVQLRQNEMGSWVALYLDTSKDAFFQVKADFVCMCTGIYSQPYIPSYEHADEFQGVQLHAKDFSNVSLAKDRNVIIVGAGKTALDCVAEVVATRTARSVTLVYRQAHYPVPRLLGNRSIRTVLFNRAIGKMLPPYYNAKPSAWVAHRIMKPVKRAFWAGVEKLIVKQFDLKGDTMPPVPLPTDLFYGGQILDNQFDSCLRDGVVRRVRGEIHCFTRNGVILQDGSYAPADLVLYCTGYTKCYDYLPGDLRARLDLQKDGVYLYRSIIPPCIANLAFIGSECSTYNNILTSGLQALWLAHMLTGRLQLPPVPVMQADVRQQQRWRREVMPAQRYRGSSIMLYMQNYHDDLVRDMGHSPQRKGLNKIMEQFGTYRAKDYSPMFAKAIPKLRAQAVIRRAAKLHQIHSQRHSGGRASAAAAEPGAEGSRRASGAGTAAADEQRQRLQQRYSAAAAADAADDSEEEEEAEEEEEEEMMWQAGVGLAAARPTPAPHKAAATLRLEVAPAAAVATEPAAAAAPPAAAGGADAAEEADLAGDMVADVNAVEGKAGGVEYPSSLQQQAVNRQRSQSHSQVSSPQKHGSTSGVGNGSPRYLSAPNGSSPDVPGAAAAAAFLSSLSNPSPPVSGTTGPVAAAAAAAAAPGAAAPFAALPPQPTVAGSSALRTASSSTLASTLSSTRSSILGSRGMPPLAPPVPEFVPAPGSPNSSRLHSIIRSRMSSAHGSGGFSPTHGSYSLSSSAGPPQASYSAGARTASQELLQAARRPRPSSSARLSSHQQQVLLQRPAAADAAAAGASSAGSPSLLAPGSENLHNAPTSPIMSEPVMSPPHPARRPLSLTADVPTATGPLLQNQFAALRKLFASQGGPDVGPAAASFGALALDGSGASSGSISLFNGPMLLQAAANRVTPGLATSASNLQVPAEVTAAMALLQPLSQSSQLQPSSFGMPVSPEGSGRGGHQQYLMQPGSSQSRSNSSVPAAAPLIAARGFDLATSSPRHPANRAAQAMLQPRTASLGSSPALPIPPARTRGSVGVVGSIGRSPQPAWLGVDAIGSDATGFLADWSGPDSNSHLIKGDISGQSECYVPQH